MRAHSKQSLQHNTQINLDLRKFKKKKTSLGKFVKLQNFKKKLTVYKCDIYCFYMIVFCNSTSNSQGVRTCLFTFAETFSKYGPDRKFVRTNQCVTVHLVYPVKLHGSPTQHARVSVSHSNTLQQEVSVTVQYSQTFIAPQPNHC